MENLQLILISFILFILGKFFRFNLQRTIDDKKMFESQMKF